MPPPKKIPKLFRIKKILVGCWEFWDKKGGKCLGKQMNPSHNAIAAACLHISHFHDCNFAIVVHRGWYSVQIGILTEKTCGKRLNFGQFMAFADILIPNWNWPGNIAATELAWSWLIRTGAMQPSKFISSVEGWHIGVVMWTLAKVVGLDVGLRE